MAKSHNFNPKAQFIVRREFKRNGVSNNVGDLFDTKGLQDNRRLKSLYDGGYIWYAWQQEQAAESAKPAVVIEEPKVEEVKVESEDKAEESKEEAKSEEKTEEVKEEKPKKASKKKSSKKDK